MEVSTHGGKAHLANNSPVKANDARGRAQPKASGAIPRPSLGAQPFLIRSGPTIASAK
jgi:hypothetical protein